jgi:hypothetical protein
MVPGSILQSTAVQMRESILVTDEELARARRDPEFRHQLLADNLELLLAELNRLRSMSANANRARQIREGVSLAVRLADLLHRIASQRSGAGHHAPSSTREVNVRPAAAALPFPTNSL